MTVGAVKKRVKNCGNFLWQKTFDGNWNDMSMDVQNDNSILIATSKLDVPYPGGSALEVRLLNADGEILEDKVWDISPGSDFPRTILAQPNGDYVVRKALGIFRCPVFRHTFEELYVVFQYINRWV